MRNKKWYVFIGVLFIFLGLPGILAFCNGTVVRLYAEKDTELKFEQDTLEVFQLRVGETIEIIFKYTNTGEVPLIISNVRTSCGCTEVQWSREPLASLKSGELKVTFRAESEGHFMKSIWVVCNIQKKVYPLHIKGEVADK